LAQALANHLSTNAQTNFTKTDFFEKLNICILFFESKHNFIQIETERESKYKASKAGGGDILTKH